MADKAVDALIAKRSKRSVLKLKLLKVRSRVGSRTIYAFEGRDDRKVFGRWIFRVAEGREYEPFVGDGKRQARQISEIIEHDRAGIGELFVFVDRDFDDLDGFEAIDFVFCTCRYSIENYLVCRSVLDLGLRDDFGLEGFPSLRQRILDQFEADYSTFLDLMTEANWRLFVAKKCGIKRLSVPKNVEGFVSVQVANVVPRPCDLSKLIELEREPSNAEEKDWRQAFSELNAYTRYRGKFAFSFFNKWIASLRQELIGGQSDLVYDEDLTDIAINDVGLIAFSARSPMPDGLRAFLEGH